MKKIALDVRPMNIKGNGISLFTENLFNKLKNTDKTEYIFLDQPESKELEVIGGRVYTKWEQFKLPFLLLKNRAKVFYSPTAINLPIIKVCKYISTIHDLVPLLYQKEYYPNKFTWFRLYRFRLWITVKNSDIIMTVSEYSKQDIIKYLGVPEEKVKVVYHGIDEKFKVVDKSGIEAVKERLNIKTKYILTMGGAEFRKNVISLINAFKLIKDKNKDFDYKLVIIGKNNLTGDEKKESDILYTGYVTDEELVALYNGAEVFVYPSLFEGFGFPPLEAMACGTAVITSNCTSIPEVVQDAAVLVDPLNIEEMAESIKKICSDDNLRNDYVEKGFKRVKDFSWEKTVSQIEEVLESIK